MRTIDQIQREIAVAEAKAANPKLKGNGIYSGEAQRKLYEARAQALRVELAQAENARQTIVALGEKTGSK